MIWFSTASEMTVEVVQTLAMELCEVLALGDIIKPESRVEVKDIIIYLFFNISGLEYAIILVQNVLPV